MTRTHVIRLSLAAVSLLLLAGLALVGMAWAGSSTTYTVDWQVLSGGGAPALSGSGHVALSGTLGQTAVGDSLGDGVTLGAGFGYGAGRGAYSIYLPLVLRNY
jgi:hypothetical protein